MGYQEGLDALRKNLRIVFFGCFLVATLLIICYASCGNKMYDDPLPPAPPPAFVVLALYYYVQQWTPLWVFFQIYDTLFYFCTCIAHSSPALTGPFGRTKDKSTYMRSS